MKPNKSIRWKIRQKNGSFKLNTQGNDANFLPLGKVNGRPIK